MVAAAKHQTLAVRSTPCVRLASFGNCFISYWMLPPGAEDVRALHDYTAELVEHCPLGITLLVVLEPGSPFLDGAQRREIEEYYARFEAAMRAVAQVVEGGNLWSVTARSVMTAMRLVQRRPYPTKVFSDVEEGAEWVAAFVATSAGKPIPVEEAGSELLRVVAGLRVERNVRARS